MPNSQQTPKENDIPENYRPLKGSERRPRRGALRVGPADPSESVLISIYVRPRPGAPPLPNQDYYAATPVGRRERLSRAELAVRYGASPEDLKVVTDFAQSSGLKIVQTDAARRLVQVSGTVAELSKAFAVELALCQSPEESYRGREGSIYLPNAVAEVVEGVFGLDNRRMVRRAGVGGANTPVPLTPPQVARAYNFPTPAEGAAGQTIAVLEFSGPAGVAESCGFAQSDIDAFVKNLNLSTTAVKSVVIPGSMGNVPFGSATTVSTAYNGDVEVTLDLEVIVSVAQNANVVVYWAPFTDQGFVDALSYINADSVNDPSVLSISYSFPELVPPGEPGAGSWEWTQQTIAAMTGAFQRAAMRHMTVLVSSGDEGSDCGVNDGNPHVNYPASDQWVIACGGTIIYTLSPLTERTWQGTGGGVSALVSLPSWQENLTVTAGALGGLSSTGPLVGRGIPDVAGNAGQQSSYVLWLYGQPTSELKIMSGQTAGQPLTPVGSGVGGTSAVAPLYAAMIALINASLNTRVGYLNPTLYRLGGSSVFRDIDDKLSNSSLATIDGHQIWVTAYTSVSGWDACTGWGSIDGTKLLNAFTITRLVASWNNKYTGVILSWDQGPETPPTTFELQRYAGEFSPSATPQILPTPTSSPYQDTPPEILATSQYQYQLIFSNAFGSNKIVSNILAPPQAPAAPKNVVAKWTVDYTNAEVTWEAVDHAEGYKVFLYKTDIFDDTTQVGNAVTTIDKIFAQGGLMGQPYISYTYVILAENKFGNNSSSFPDTNASLTVPIPVSPPSTPEGPTPEGPPHIYTPPRIL